MIQLIPGDCLIEMSALPLGSVDMILCDLPYGTTACKWDSVIPFEPLWTHYKRLIKPGGAIVLFGSQPFTTDLIQSNRKDFRYCWVWDKQFPGDVLNANKKPLKYHEDICVFYSRLPVYNPQKWQGKPNNSVNRSTKKRDTLYGCRADVPCDTSGLKYPRSIIAFQKHSSRENLHRTQKPVALLEYLIKTYTNEGETVLDNCFGSCSTGIAAINTGRSFIGIERDPHYFAVGQQRIKDAQAQPALLVA